MGNIQVDPSSLQEPANIYGRAGNELISRIAGTFSSAASLSGDAFGNASADAAYSETQRKVANSLPASADALMAMARQIAAAAGGYLVSDKTSATSLTGIPTGLGSINPLQSPAVPGEYALLPNNTTNYTDTSYRIVPKGSGK
jgi:uncharacterized protein YukE